MTFTQYLELLEWTGRQVAKGKVSQIPVEQPSILQQLEIEGKGWLKLVGSFTDKRVRLRRAIGRPAGPGSRGGETRAKVDPGNRPEPRDLRSPDCRASVGSPVTG
jgi:hypothetical protein